MSSIKDDIADMHAETALNDSRALVDLFGGPSRPPMTFAQQADVVEYILRSCSRSANGKGEIMITLPVDAAILADLSLTALRLRKLAPFEADIRDLVTRR